jgi:hypothetical protein
LAPYTTALRNSRSLVLSWGVIRFSAMNHRCLRTWSGSARRGSKDNFARGIQLTLPHLLFYNTILHVSSKNVN